MTVRLTTEPTAHAAALSAPNRIRRLLEIQQYLTCQARSQARKSPCAVSFHQPKRNRVTEPSPLDFNDHEGYVSSFDGKTLDGWDGNPKFWRVEDGAIVGKSTPERLSGNSYMAFRRMEAKDFTLNNIVVREGRGRRVSHPRFSSSTSASGRRFSPVTAAHLLRCRTP
jgi:hypothetical protein